MLAPTIADWHAQFTRQARWTQGTRNYLYRQARLLQAERVLDVGCGTGTVTEELARRCRGEVIGIDLDPRMLAFARGQAGRARYQEGNALSLPFPDEHFDVAHCHLTLLWVSDPTRAAHEMARVVRQGGSVLVCAEPDYGGRLDWPELPIRQWQIAGLRRQGADPLIGRRLRQILASAGLKARLGVIPSLWDGQSMREQFESEWQWLQYDAGEDVSPAAFARAKAQAREAIDAGTRLVYVPFFYARASRT